MPTKLQHKIFVSHYIKQNFNGTKAYMRAYPNIKDAKTASVCASKLLSKDSIKQELNRQLTKKNMINEHSRDIILTDVNRLAVKSEAFMEFGNALKAQDLRAKLAGLYHEGDSGSDQFDRIIQAFQINVSVGGQESASAEIRRLPEALEEAEEAESE